MASRLSRIIILFLFPGTIVFSQCIDGDCYNGQGTYVFPSGAKYEGAFRKGALHGYGKCFFTNGDVYAGQWDQNIRQGEGIFRKKDGTEYAGSFRNNQPHGSGKLTFPDGSVFEAEWAKGESVGAGLLTDLRGRQQKGRWAAGSFLPLEEVSKATDQEQLVEQEMPRTHGIYVFADGSRYEGEMLNGAPFGKGSCFYANGDVYTGEWYHGQPHGKGTIHYANDILVTGTWSFGQIRHPEKSYVALPAQEQKPEVDIYALIVGVSRYPDFESLKYTDDDAYQFYAFLKSPEGGAVPDQHIQLLIDESAIAENIDKAIDEVVSRADSNDVVILYFAGHGLGGFFIPYDCNGYTNKLHYESIRNKLKYARAKHKLCIVDACYSGSLLASKAPMMESLNLFYHRLSDTGGGIAFLMSSKEEEISLESKGLRQGIFSHFLIEGLKGKANVDQDKIITIGELHAYVRKAVRDYTGDAQNPVLAGRFDQNMPVGLIR